MPSIFDVIRNFSSGFRPGKLSLLLMTIVGALVPGFALAAGGGGVQLSFADYDQINLIISLGFGVLALVVGMVLMSKVKAASPGDDRMQAVGAAIRDGAMAYLKKQFTTMLVFVVLLGAGIGFMYSSTFGWGTATAMAFCFLGGVLASYLAGYIGMVMAVASNMRTAAAALTSYRRSQEIAFQSGGVAGLMTVGMGLVGATLIFYFGGANAMKLLIGFGFGGSLAALFMRVGGGIYTKAADVGADLVGKVEAGIPEDDPRNPATIADNVGDNVGDCAGMAADVFESYEVTLVAAIVLGAATASLFDQQTWMRLIMFALMARGVGILASIFGILTFKASDDLNSEPLKPISKGFTVSALVAVAGTALVAYLMMGGKELGPQFTKLIKTNELVSTEQFNYEQNKEIVAVRDKIAAKRKIKAWDVTAEEILKDPQIAAKFKDEEKFTAQNAVSTALRGADTLKAPEKLDGFTKVDFSNSSSALLGMTAVKMGGPGQSKPEFKSVREVYGQEVKGKKGPDGKPLVAARPLNIIHVKQSNAGAPDVPNQPNQPKDRDFYVGPIDDAQIEELKKRPEFKIVKTIPAYFYEHSDGRIVVGVEPGFPADKVRIQPVPLFRATPKEVTDAYDAMQKAMQDRAASPDRSQPQLPPQVTVSGALVKHKFVEWWRFALCVIFGIVMAFFIERLTNYYVSMQKRPVREVADAATAGPAPMIIQGFAYGKESSVMSVFAIVIALLTPLFIFPPAAYGSYILSFFGIALVGLGLLTTTGYILAMDTFGPISDNAQGIFEMSGAGHKNPEASRAVQRLDAAGNTTKALTKGFAIATAVVAAVALFHSYLEDGKLTALGLRLELPEIFLGLLIGGAAPYLFSAFSINAVGRAAFELINEVRRQFRDDKGILAGTSKPDYGRCVAIVTAAAQRELLGPGILAIALPVLVGFGFAIGKETTTIGGLQFNLVGAQALGGFLAGAILSGQLLAVMLANAGGIWDNAKKLIEDGLHGGKGTEAHKAGVVCDTVGDPFKDTAGPALNPLIKVMNLVALLLVPVMIQPLSQATLITISLVALGALVLAFWWSKRGSLSTSLTRLQEGPVPAAMSAPTGAVASIEDEPVKAGSNNE